MLKYSLQNLLIHIILELLLIDLVWKSSGLGHDYGSSVSLIFRIERSHKQACPVINGCKMQWNADTNRDFLDGWLKFKIKHFTDCREFHAGNVPYMIEQMEATSYALQRWQYAQGIRHLL